MDISFSGAGFMGCYYFGVIDFWRKYVPSERVKRVAGTSAGSLIAAQYVTCPHEELPDSLREIISLLEGFRARRLGVFDRRVGQIVDLLPKMFDRILPEDAHKKATGKLFVCMTRVRDMKKILVSEFETKKDLIDALNCSSFIPVWSGNSFPTYKGEKHMDGGFKDNLPTFDEHTIRICCFSGNSDISPYDRAKLELLSASVQNMHMHLNFGNCRRFKKALSPPTPNYVIDLLERGFIDAKNFVLDNDLIQCDSCFSKIDLKDQPIFSSLCPPTLTPSVSPAISRIGSYRKSNDEDVRKENKITFARTDNSLSPNQINHGGAFKNSCFNNMLVQKLDESRNRSRSSGFVSEDSGDNNSESSNSTDAPMIVVEDVTTSTESSPEPVLHGDQTDDGAISAEDQKSNPRLPHGSNKFLSNRRSSLAARKSDSTNNHLPVLKERFKLAPNPLPSCPPSPNINRHCTECLRLRQQARADSLDSKLVQVSQEFQSKKVLDGENRMMMKLGSPIRWIRQLGVRSSYTFSDCDLSSAKGRAY